VNDPVVDPSTNAIYVSVRHATNIDGVTTVLRIDRETGSVSNVADPGAFGRRPSGVILYKRGLVVVNTDGDFWQVVFGRDQASLSRLGTSSLRLLHGIERFGDSFLFTQNGGGPISATNPVPPTVGVLAQIRFRSDGTHEERPLCVLQPLEQAADIGIDPEARIVAIPHLNTGKITFVSLDDLL
jgi:hypothetical protein